MERQYLQNIRRNFLYNTGKIGLTLGVLLVSRLDASEQVSKLEQVCDTKGRSTGGEDDTGVRGSHTGPSRWQRPHVARSIVKRDAVFSPIVAVCQDFKLLAVQGMKRMGDRENPFCQRGSRCS